MIVFEWEKYSIDSCPYSSYILFNLLSQLSWMLENLFILNYCSIERRARRKTQTKIESSKIYKNI